MLNVDFKTIFKEYYIKRKSEPQLIIESKIIDWVMMYQFMKRMALPFRNWDAFKEGIIDENGVLLREPTDKERETIWGYFDRIVWNIKKIITKFTGNSGLTSATVSALLLKENIKEENIEKLLLEMGLDSTYISFNNITLEEIQANITHLNIIN